MKENIAFIELINEIIKDYNEKLKFSDPEIVNIDFILKEKVLDVSKYYLINIFGIYKYLSNNGIFEVDYDFLIEMILKNDFKKNIPSTLRNVYNNSINNSIFFINEIYESFINDFSELVNQFNISDECKIVKIDFLGDSHNNGRCVSLVKLSNDKSLIYRPTNISCYKLLEQYVALFDQVVGIPKLMEKENHSWIEFIEEQSPECLEDYSSKAGKFLAFCQLLGIEDLHFQNIRFSRGKFYILDFETAFGGLEQYEQKKIVINNFEISLDKTPLFTSLLPIWSKGVFGGLIDNSGFFGPNGLDYTSFKFNDIGLSTIRFESLKNTYFKKSYISTKIFIQGYNDEILNFKDKFQNGNKVRIFGLKKIRRRKIYRSTSEYFVIKELYCKNASTGKILPNLLEKLLRINSNIPSDIIQLEVEAIINGDIPYFQENININDVNLKIINRIGECIKYSCVMVDLINNAIDSLKLTSNEIENC